MLAPAGLTIASTGEVINAKGIPRPVFFRRFLDPFHESRIDFPARKWRKRPLNVSSRPLPGSGLSPWAAPQDLPFVAGQFGQEGEHHTCGGIFRLPMERRVSSVGHT